MDILKKLSLPDYLSLIGLFFAWISIVLITSGQPNLAIIFNIGGAFLLDILDGFYARKLGLERVLGRQVDSFVDIFTYLVFSALFFLKFLAPSQLMGILVGFFILYFGGLRLIRFNNEGILKSNGKDYYRGITVVHISFLVLVFYFLSRFTRLWNKWLSVILLLFIIPLMLSDIKSYKIKNFWFFGVIIFLFLISSLILENAHIK